MNTTKQAIRQDTAELVERYLANGGEIHRIDDPRARGTHLRGKDWARAAQGLKVATPEEIATERERRAIIALRNKDVELLAALLRGRHDKAIKFDIENDRLGPNGEIR